MWNLAATTDCPPLICSSTLNRSPSIEPSSLHSLKSGPAFVASSAVRTSPREMPAALGTPIGDLVDDTSAAHANWPGH